MTFSRCLRLGTFGLCFGMSLFAQGRGIIPVQSSFQRVYAVVPLIGSGRYDDPIRPMFVPANGFRQNLPSAANPNARPGPRTGLLSYSFVRSDDGRSALVEFVSADRAGLREILESKAPGVVAFEASRVSKADVELAFKGKRADFDFSKFVNKVR